MAEIIEMPISVNPEVAELQFLLLAHLEDQNNINAAARQAMIACADYNESLMQELKALKTRIFTLENKGVEA